VFTVCGETKSWVGDLAIGMAVGDELSDGEL
jgi:hypothetical protein